MKKKVKTTIAGVTLVATMIVGGIALSPEAKEYTDYKFWYVRRDDSGVITEAAIRFYEGSYQNKNGKQVYERSKRLEEVDLVHLKSQKIQKEKNGYTAIVYTPEDFGVISSDYELKLFLDSEIKKDKKRQVIPEQKI